MTGYAKVFFISGCLNAAIAIGLGAAGAHALKAHLAALDPGAWFDTALHYHQIHSLALLALGLAVHLFPSSRWFVWSGCLMMAGMLLFSGGLYLLSLGGIRIVTGGIPAGGVALILAWLSMAVGAGRLSPRAP